MVQVASHHGFYRLAQLAKCRLVTPGCAKRECLKSLLVHISSSALEKQHLDRTERHRMLRFAATGHDRAFYDARP